MVRKMSQMLASNQMSFKMLGVIERVRSLKTEQMSFKWQILDPRFPGLYKLLRLDQEKDR